MTTRIPKKLKDLLATGKAPQWALNFINKKREQLSRWRQPGVPFLVGQKQVYLPNFTITLIRSPKLPPTWASFKVPLNFNKFDLRDYLFNAYNVRVHEIRSHVRQFPIQQIPRGSPRSLPGKKKYYRPQSEKRMTVRLDQPFVWPKEPKGKELEPFDHARFKRIEKMQERNMTGKDLDGQYETTQRRKKLRERAQALLSGKEKWRSIDPSAVPAPLSGSAQLPAR